MIFMSGIRRKKVSDLVGKVFNRLTVVGYLEKGKHNRHFWKCSCTCGGEIVLHTARLTAKSVTTKSCGCLRKEKLLSVRFDPTTHNLHDTKLYGVYQSMKQRCTNKNSQRYEYYGAKGVKVLWEDVEDFVVWAYDSGYKEGLSIDRIDSDGHYEPANCRWITLEENTRRAHIGKAKKSSGGPAESVVQEDICST
jgi:hypothetical protein